MKLFRKYRSKVVARFEVHAITAHYSWHDEVRVQDILKDGFPEVGKTYLLIEEVK